MAKEEYDAMVNEGITVGVDASNILGVGGLKHITEVLAAAQPKKYGIKKVIVWLPPSVMAAYPVRPWLQLVPVRDFEMGIFRRLLWRYFFLKRQMQKKCDVIFFPGGLSMHTGKPDIVMSQNMQPFDINERRASGFGWQRIRLEALRIFQGRSFRSSSRVLFLTEYAKKEVYRHSRFDVSKASIIPHGVSGDFLVAERKHSDLRISNQIRVLYVSNIHSYKNHINVIEAVNLLADSYSNIVLKLVGGGNEYNKKEVLAKIHSVNESRKRDLVEYAGVVAPVDMPQTYRGADIFVFASSCENFPNILLEAMASGLPIVCSEAKPMPMILKSAGIYCDEKSPTSIAGAIERYISSESLRLEKSRLALQATSQYSWRNASQKTFELFTQLAKNSEL